MTDKNLQGAEAQKEVVGKTPTEAEKQTPTETKTTIGKTYTQEELDRGVSKATETFRQQATLSKTQAEAAEARANKVEGELDGLMTEKFADDTDGLASFRRKQELAKMARDIDTKRAELEKTEWAIGMYHKARELSGDTGIPIAELESCKDEAEMTKKTITWLKEQKPKSEEEEAPPKIDPGVSTALGVDDKSLSSSDKVRKGLDQLKPRKI